MIIALPPSRCNSHEVFRVVTGVADQLQTNYASDLRSILKTLFEVMATKIEQGDNDKQNKGKNASASRLPGFWRRNRAQMLTT